MRFIVLYYPKKAAQQADRRYNILSHYETNILNWYAQLRLGTIFLYGNLGNQTSSTLRQKANFRNPCETNIAPRTQKDICM